MIARPAIERLVFVPGRFYFNKMGYFEHSRMPYRVVMLVVCLFGLSQVRAARPASARDQVPPSSQRQWAPSNLAGYQMNPTQQENPTSKATPDFSSQSSSHPARGKIKRFFILILGLVIIGLAVVLSLSAWNFNERHPRTDDGVARANIIGIAPRVSGPIIHVHVSDNQSVQSGDLLFEIDPADYQLSVDRAKAAGFQAERFAS